MLRGALLVVGEGVVEQLEEIALELVQVGVLLGLELLLDPEHVDGVRDDLVVSRIGPALRSPDEGLAEFGPVLASIATDEIEQLLHLLGLETEKQSSYF